MSHDWGTDTAGAQPIDAGGAPPQVPGEIHNYLEAVHERTADALGGDLVGMWLIGSSAQSAYEHGVSDVDVLALSRTRWPTEDRRRLGARLVHPELPCPTSGLEFVWYALPDLETLADPVRFQLNVNGGLSRASVVQVEPDASANYWSVLDLAGARQVGVPLAGSPPAASVLPEVPSDRLHKAVRESIAWHEGPDAGSPNRVLNLARLLVMLEDGRWLSKPAGAEVVRSQHPELAPAIDEALRARAEKRWMDPAPAAPLSAALRAHVTL